MDTDTILRREIYRQQTRSYVEPQGSLIVPIPFSLLLSHLP